MRQELSVKPLTNSITKNYIRKHMLAGKFEDLGTFILSVMRRQQRPTTRAPTHLMRLESSDAPSLALSCVKFRVVGDGSFRSVKLQL